MLNWMLIYIPLQYISCDRRKMKSLVPQQLSKTKKIISMFRLEKTIAYQVELARFCTLLKKQPGFLDRIV